MCRYRVCGGGSVGFEGCGCPYVRAVLGQRHRERQERDPRSFLGEPVPGRGPHAGGPQPEPARRRPARSAGSPPAGAVSGKSSTLTPLEHVPLAPRCTMGVGGSARFFVEAADEATVVEAARWAEARRLSLRVLGGGSNLVGADARAGARVLHGGLPRVAS